MANTGNTGAGDTGNTDLITITPDRSVLKRRRAWYIVAIALAIGSVVIQQPLVFLAALLTLLIAVVPEIWYRYALRHLSVRCFASQRRLFFGEELTLFTSIENRKWLPLPWLQSGFSISPPMTVLSQHSGHLERINYISNTWQCWAFQRITRRYPLHSRARGCYTIGPVALRISDPFGWLESSVTLPINETVVVYPLIVPVESADFPPVHPFGEHAAHRHLIEDPLRIAGVRDYQPGDDPRRIHWKATAHAGELRSKIYEYSTMRRMLILLDTRNYSRAWMGIDPEMQELTISAAASIAVWALDEGYMVGLLANCGIMAEPDMDEMMTRTRAEHRDDLSNPDNDETGDDQGYHLTAPGIHVPFALDDGQYERVLSMMARLVPRHTMPLEDVIEQEQRLFQPGTLVVLVSTATAVSEETALRLLDMRRRGIVVHCALTGKTEDAASIEDYGLPVHHLGGRELWHELIQAASDRKSATISIHAIHSMAFRLD